MICRGKTIRIIRAAGILFLLMLMSVMIASAAGERATFKTGSLVRKDWTELAGSRSNVTAIRQYKGNSVP